jgi:uncharacterized membrane protein HdeD (DUF308 family)
MNDLQDLRANWGWIFTFGCLLVLSGMIAITYSVIATLVSVIFLGWLLIFSGVLEGVYVVRHRERGHVLLYLLEALLAIIMRALLLQSPVRGAIVLTLLLATYFLVAGVFRIVGAIALHLPHRGWLLASGVINIALGILLWGGWPVTGWWVLGVFIGVNMLFNGWARIMLARALKSSDRREPLAA